MRRADDAPGQILVPLGPDPTVRRLSPREREIAMLLAQGLTDAAIGQRLGMATGSVSNTVQRIRLRLQLDCRAEVAAWVIARLDPDDPSGGSLRRVGTSEAPSRRASARESAE
jgi:DNA-binding NarL/FixJ family response regulator